MRRTTSIDNGRMESLVLLLLLLTSVESSWIILPVALSFLGLNPKKSTPLYYELLRTTYTESNIVCCTFRIAARA
jgi:hypothetical protein